MSIRDTIDYIEDNKEEFLKQKKYHFYCDGCVQLKPLDEKACYSSEENPDLVYCEHCIEQWLETGEWEK